MADLQPKRSLGYRVATDPKTCHVCEHMNADGSCDRVEGMVAPDHTCHAWGPRAAW